MAFKFKQERGEFDCKQKLLLKEVDDSNWFCRKEGKSLFGKVYI